MFTDDRTRGVMPNRINLYPTVYDHIEYLGNAFEMKIGYNQGPLGPVANDTARSVRIPSGFRVTLYEHSFWEGRELVLTDDVPDLKALGFDGIVSNARVEWIGDQVDIALLQGESPALLKMMAATPADRDKLNLGPTDTPAIVAGLHCQAVGQFGSVTYIAQSRLDKDVGGRLWIYDNETKISTSIELDAGFPHPCNIQVVRDHLVIAVEARYSTLEDLDTVNRDHKSRILIFTLHPSPTNPKLVALIDQPSINCGGAGLAYHPKLDRWFIFADQDGVDGKPGSVVGTAIYRSTGSTPAFWETVPFKRYATRFGSGAGFNLITASDGSIWGIHYTDGDKVDVGAGAWEMIADEVYLFLLIDPEGKEVAELKAVKQVTNYTSPAIKAAGQLLSDRPSMRFGASLYFDTTSLVLITCARNVSPAFPIDRKNLRSDTSCVMLVNDNVLPIEMYYGTAKCESLLFPGFWEAHQPPGTRANINYSTVIKWMDLWDEPLSAPLTLIVANPPKDVRVFSQVPRPVT